MAFEEEILSEQLKADEFHNEDSKVSGIAQLAVDRGWNTLSPAQKSVLRPFLTKPCEGVCDPAGEHNGCEAVLTEAELKDAYEELYQYDSLLCQSCQDESNDIAAHKASFFKE